jgi:hypothetical protein
MQVDIIKKSGIYELGIVDVTDARGNYLIRIGVATDVKAVESKKTPAAKKPATKAAKKKTSG